MRWVRTPRTWAGSRRSCPNHKLRNVLGHLPKDQHPQVKAAFRAAMKLDAKQGEQKLE